MASLKALRATKSIMFSIFLIYIYTYLFMVKFANCVLVKVFAYPTTPAFLLFFAIVVPLNFKHYFFRSHTFFLCSLLFLNLHHIQGTRKMQDPLDELIPDVI